MKGTYQKRTVYHKRKAAGLCVYDGCKRKPELGKHGKRRSYCPFHIAANRKNSEAWLKRQQESDATMDDANRPNVR
jgi:hypothetical protein